MPSQKQFFLARWWCFFWKLGLIAVSWRSLLQSFPSPLFLDLALMSQECFKWFLLIEGRWLKVACRSPPHFCKGMQRLYVQLGSRGRSAIQAMVLHTLPKTGCVLAFGIVAFLLSNTLTTDPHPRWLDGVVSIHGIAPAGDCIGGLERPQGCKLRDKNPSEEWEKTPWLKLLSSLQSTYIQRAVFAHDLCSVM